MVELQGLEKLVSLKGKMAMITGAAAGIGRAIARRFAQAGADLYLVDIDGPNLDQFGAELDSEEADIQLAVIDLSSKAQIDALWDGMDRLPDVLVNNAGVYPFRSFLDMDERFYREVIETNLYSVSWMCQHMIRMRGKAGGVIVNIGSIEALVAFKDDLAHYAVSKAGVIALTRALAKEHARHGFRVNALLPGGIVTKGTKNAARKILKFKFDLLRTGLAFRQRLPAGRAGQPDEVARMALVLASDLASYVHGAAIPVDGGFLSA